MAAEKNNKAETYIDNEKGWAMPLVVVVMVVLTLLGTALWVYSMTDLKHVAREENKMQAHYYARSGAELVAAGIGTEQDQLDPASIPEGEANALVSNSITFKETSLLEETYLSDCIEVRVYKDNGDIVIVSTGSENGVSQTLSLKLTIQNNEIISEYWISGRYNE